MCQGLAPWTFFFTKFRRTTLLYVSIHPFLCIIQSVVVVVNKSRPFTHALPLNIGDYYQCSCKRLFLCLYASRTPHDSKSVMCRCAEEKHSAWPKGNGCARVLPQAINRVIGLIKVDTVRDRLAP